MKNAGSEVIAVLEEARELLTRKGNNYAWSSYWKSEAEAVAQVDGLIQQIRSRGDVSSWWWGTHALFRMDGPGPLYQMADGNKWGEERFRRLAIRAEEALRGAHELMKPGAEPVQESGPKVKGRDR